MVEQEKKTIIKCGECAQEFELGKETLEERPYTAANMSNVTQVVLKCPQCSATTHCYFNGPHLKRFQAQLDMAIKEFNKNRTRKSLRAWQRLKKRFQVEFDRFQKTVQEADHA